MIGAHKITQQKYTISPSGKTRHCSNMGGSRACLTVRYEIENILRAVQGGGGPFSLNKWKLYIIFFGNFHQHPENQYYHYQNFRHQSLNLDSTKDIGQLRNPPTLVLKACLLRSVSTLLTMVPCRGEGPHTLLEQTSTTFGPNCWNWEHWESDKRIFQSKPPSRLQQPLHDKGP